MSFMGQLKQLVFISVLVFTIILCFCAIEFNKSKQCESVGYSYINGKCLKIEVR